MKIQNSISRFCGWFLVAGVLSLVNRPAQASYESTVLADNPLAFYALNPATDGTDVAPDLTTNGNDGDVVGITAATGPSPFITNAANFNGDAAIDLSQGDNPGLLNFTGPITLEAWVQASSSSLFGDIVAKGYDSSSYDEIALRGNGQYGANFFGTSGSTGVTGGAETTYWSYVVLSSDGTNCSLYVNGELAARNPDTSGSIEFSDDWVIGDGSSSGSGRPWNGNISEVAIYGYGLTAAQVKTHYLIGQYGTTVVPAPRNLKWSASGSSGVWDTGITTSWLNQANSQETTFDFGDDVVFDDTPGVATTVAMNEATLTTGSITVDSSANNFVFNGPGGLSGPSSLLKEGSSQLTIYGPVAPTIPVTISGGSIYAGNNSLDLVPSIAIASGTTLDLGGGSIVDDASVSVSGTGLNGEGALINSYGDDPQELLNITLGGDTLFAGSARWDFSSGTKISGPYSLTLDLSGGAGYMQLNSITVGANVQQITLTNSGSLGMTGMDTSCQNPATVFNIGANDYLTLYNGGFNGSLNLASGVTFTMYSGNVNLGGSTIHVNSGATMYLYASGIAMTGNNLILENDATIQTYYNGGLNPINNAVTLNGVAHFVLGDHEESFYNVVSGAGGFVIDYYNNELAFSAANTYTGPTIIGSSGNSPEVALLGNGSISDSSLIFFGGSDPTVAHLDVSGRNDDTLTLASGQTLAGIGGVNGNLVVAAGATISPAGTNTTIGITTGSDAVGELAASGNVTLSGTTVIKLDGSGTNDAIEAAGDLTYGGTLSLVNISGSPLAAGNSFQVFSAANYSQSFTSITPATPGAGLAWDTSHLSSGQINVIASSSGPAFSGAAISGGNLVLSGTGGTAGATYYVVGTTNLTIPLSLWPVVSTNQFKSNGSFSATNAVVPGVSQMFYAIKAQ